MTIKFTTNSLADGRHNSASRFSFANVEVWVTKAKEYRKAVDECYIGLSGDRVPFVVRIGKRENEGREDAIIIALCQLCAFVYRTSNRVYVCYTHTYTHTHANT